MSCPICGKAADEKYRPFCSRRCADADLGRWLTGSYVVPGPEAEDDASSDAEPEAPAPQRRPQ
ncbi:MAG: DNA gyrase inhibitor YacG [Cypionkella sp.]